MNERNPTKSNKMTDKQEEKSICVLTFSGKDEDWDMWSKKFLAMAQRKKYKDILTGKTNIPKEDATLTNEDEKKAREANEKAYSDLILSCTDEVSFGLVEGAITKDNPSGDSALAWKEFNEEYDPDVGTALADLKREFAQSKLDVEQKPEEWIRSLEKIQTKLKTHGHEIMKDDMILHILSNLPEEYDNTIERLEESYGTKTLDLKTIK